jgi:hypothetical protein
MVLEYRLVIDRGNGEADGFCFRDEPLSEGDVVTVSGPPGTEIDGMSVVILRVDEHPEGERYGRAYAKPAQ